mmetsp:Transcript_25738/g.56742  ORF Transcript_25738/g.56742 Transcript_25738/m.56742 type:complete len:458 (+) Transcript_25738:67-1440(+)
MFVDDSLPFAQRSDTMSLDVIRPPDVPRGKVKFIKPESMSLKTDDIHKATPYYAAKEYLHKPSAGFIDGTRANTLYPPTKRVTDNALRTQDIEYAQPKINRFNTERCLDPLQPHYQLPHCEVKPPTPPRWNGRNTLDVSDIEHTCPRRVIPDRNYVCDPNDTSDIEYSCPNYRRRVVRPVDDFSRSTNLEIKDINAPDNRVPAVRNTDPNDPVYKVAQTTTTSLLNTWSEEAGHVEPPPMEVQHVGEIAQSKPRKLQWDNGEPQFSLLKEDIAGASTQRWVGSIPFNVYDPPDKKAVISFHEPQDVPGAQVGSLKKGIVTNRALHPLQPDYTLLDGTVNNASQRWLMSTGFEAERGSQLRAAAQEALLGTGSAPPSRERERGSGQDNTMMRSTMPVMRRDLGTRNGSNPASGQRTPVGAGAFGSGPPSRRSSARSVGSDSRSRGGGTAHERLARFLD